MYDLDSIFKILNGFITGRERMKNILLDTECDLKEYIEIIALNTTMKLLKLKKCMLSKKLFKNIDEHNDSVQFLICITLPKCSEYPERNF